MTVRADARAAAAHAARTAYGKLIATLAKRTGDIAAAEDALGHAFAKALNTWPETGVPEAPEAWLTTVARRAILDDRKRAATAAAGEPTLALLAEERAEFCGGDPRLGLILAASHPAIAPAVHAPLILQTVFGVTAEQMAPAFLVSPAAIGQRLARAKAKIKAARVPFTAEPPDLTDRMKRALDAIYALHTIALATADGVAKERADDALDLALLMTTLAPREPEALGLAALLSFSAARARERRNGEGAYVPLSKQDARGWDATRIEAGEALLSRAAELGEPGPYQIEAAIQSVHCHRSRTGRTDWRAIATFYDVLVTMVSSVGAGVARAAAHGQAFGSEAGLAILTALPEVQAHRYQPYWAVRAHLSPRGEKQAAYDNAIALTEDAAVRAHLTALKAAHAAA